MFPMDSTHLDMLMLLANFGHGARTDTVALAMELKLTEVAQYKLVIQWIGQTLILTIHQSRSKKTARFGHGAVIALVLLDKMIQSIAVHQYKLAPAQCGQMLLAPVSISQTEQSSPFKLMAHCGHAAKTRVANWALAI
jgi:hypothetical protein